MENTLQLVFRNEEGGLFTISIAFPKNNLTEAVVAAAMDNVIVRNIFESTGGPLVAKVRARIVSREVQDLAIFE